MRDTAGSPERARWHHVARSGSQSQRAIWLILPARGDSHIIKVLNNRYVLVCLIEVSVEYRCFFFLAANVGK